MKEIFFFMAFLGCLWTFTLVFGAITGHFDKSQKESVREKYEWYKTQRGLFITLLKWMFLFFNGHVLFPLRGLAVSIISICIFILID